jgi:PTH1 family peptidyl-tRNA hydrolase
MYIIVGLGNPGAEYEKTRHNTGRIFVEHFAKATDCAAFEFDKKNNAWKTSGEVEKKKFVALLPDTFMNKSGNAVKNLVTSKAKAKELIVIHDDLDIPFGKFKISFGKNSGGHKGVESIMRAVKTKDFIRIRVGISAKKKTLGAEKVDKLILGNFKSDELLEIKKLAKKINLALEAIIAKGLQVALSQI